MTMTTLIAHPLEDRLRSVLAVDGVVVGLCGLLLTLTPASWYGDLPGWFVRLGGVLLVGSAVAVGGASRGPGHRLVQAAAVTADLAYVWTGVTVVLAEYGHVRGAGLEVLALGGVATLVFGMLETSLVRALR